MAISHILTGNHLVVGAPPTRLEANLGKDSSYLRFIFREVGQFHLRVLFVDILQREDVETLDNQPVSQVL